MFLWGINVTQESPDVRDIFLDIETISTDEIPVFASERVGRIADYYGYTHEVFPKNLPVASIENHSGARWYVIGEDEIEEHSFIAEAGLESDLQRTGIVAYCVDGIEQPCPE